MTTPGIFSPLVPLMRPGRTPSFRLVQGLDQTKDLDQFLCDLNEGMEMGGLLEGYSRLNSYFRYRYFQHGPMGRLGYVWDFICHRVFPKLHPLTRSIYTHLTKERKQHFSRTEVIGRLSRAGFMIKYMVEEKDELRFSAIKVGKADRKGNPSYWPFFPMKRVGKNGKLIHVYKVRTMHPYAEYAQEYIRQTNGLEASGKFKNDFRITSWGRLLRRYWLDEIPMLFNLLKGDIKLVGVRPISSGYLKLYPVEFQEYRKKFKPGLIPPYYADMPGNFDEIVESERRYFEAYERKALVTDILYLYRIFTNILFKKARSK